MKSMLQVTDLERMITVTGFDGFTIKSNWGTLTLLKGDSALQLDRDNKKQVELNIPYAVEIEPYCEFPRLVTFDTFYEALDFIFNEYPQESQQLKKYSRKELRTGYKQLDFSQQDKVGNPITQGTLIGTGYIDPDYVLDEEWVKNLTQGCGKSSSLGTLQSMFNLTNVFADIQRPLATDRADCNLTKGIDISKLSELSITSYGVTTGRCTIPATSNVPKNNDLQK